MKSAEVMTQPRLLVPDAVALSAVQKLCDLEKPYASSRELDELFLQGMSQIIEWHRAHSPIYAALLKQQNFAGGDLHAMSDLEKIPFIAAGSFKEREILSIPKDQVTVHLTSSGTTGQKSQIFFDEWTLHSAQRMLDWIFAFYGFDRSDRSVAYLLLTYEPKPKMNLGTSFTDHYLCKYAPAEKTFYGLRNDGSGGHEFDAFGCIEFLEQCARENLPVRIFGFPAFLHFTVQRFRQLGRRPLKLHPDSLVFLGGGWKGHADKAISKEHFYRELAETFGLRDERMRDGYGSVEHCIPYVECKNHHLHIPTWSRVLIRDVRTLKPLPNGQTGFLQFISPYITSVPAHAVLMGDLAVRHSGDECDCGLGTDWFEIQGRAGTSKNRSCAVAAAELLRGPS